MAVPLLVHLVFHPASDEARQLARHVYRALNHDPNLPGLRLPTVLLPEDGSLLPPEKLALDEGEHSIVVVFADDTMVIEQSILPGRRSWPDFVASLADECARGAHRFLPVQITDSAWPLHEDLKEINFLRAHTKPDAERPHWIERALIIEMCRFLLGLGRGVKVPVRIFISHAKQDIETKPYLFKKVSAHLSATQPVEAWIDSGQIEMGANFPQRIEDAIKGSAVLALATASYSARPWCRREVLIAKAHDQALVFATGIKDLELRSFPYSGNVPDISWDADGARRSVDLLLKEVLRKLHAQRELARKASASDVVLTSPPELVTLARLPKDCTVLYPDPPLGDEELEVLQPMGRRLETPLQRAGSTQSLAKSVVSLSISESDDIAKFGMLPEQLDVALLEVSRQLLVRGAALAYGGHLGKEGYTQALFELVHAHQQMSGLPQLQRVRNYVGWPLPLEKLPVDRRAELVKVATLLRVARPDGIEHLEPQTFVAEPTFFPDDTAVRRYAWARGMTQMRETQTAQTAARIVLGGKCGPTKTATAEGGTKVEWYKGRIPGVVEEALCSLLANKPIYLCGAFGGAAALLIDLLQGRPRDDFTWEFQRQAPFSDELRARYQAEGVKWWDYPEMSEFLGQRGVAGLAQTNGLSVEENRELFACRDLTRLVELILVGLDRVLSVA